MADGAHEVAFIWDTEGLVPDETVEVYAVADDLGEIPEFDETNNAHYQAVINPAIAGDVDFDRDVDIADLAYCLGGPGVPPDPSLPATPDMCTNAFDVDTDDDVDLKDFGEFQTAFSK